jgi:hypothetical protein
LRAIGRGGSVLPLTPALPFTAFTSRSFLALEK